MLAAANVDAHGTEELEGAAAGGGFRAAEHDADLFANLISEDTDALGLADHGGEATHGLRHEARLGADRGVAHLAIEFVLGNERGYRVDDDDVNGVGANKGFGDVERVFTGVGLGNEKVVEVHADGAGVFRVEGVLHINEGSQATVALGFGDHAKTERGLTGGFRTVDFHDASAR